MRAKHILPLDGFLIEGVLLSEARTYRLWESVGKKLVEAELTPDQITQLFQQVEQGATSAGSNRTILGKGKDVASAVSKAWEDLKTKVQNSGPIKNVDAVYDQAAEKLKQATGGDQGVMQYVQKYRDFAKKHPVAQGIIYSALIAAAGISGAGLGGAAALGLFKMVDKLLQGEKFSSATYSGAKTGAMAYAAGQIGKAIKGNQLGTQPAQQGTTGSEISGAQPGTTQEVWQKAYNQSMKEFPGDATGARAAADMAARNAMNSGTAIPTNESTKTLSRLAVFAIIEQVAFVNAMLTEGIWDNIKGKAAQIGKNITTKVTTDKLQSAWKKAGSPTDSEAVAKVLKDAGISDDIISSVYQGMKIPAPTPTTANGGAATAAATGEQPPATGGSTTPPAAPSEQPPATGGSTTPPSTSGVQKSSTTSVAPVASTGPETFAQYLLAWFGKYMAGTDWKSREATIKPIVLDIEQKYLSKGDWKGGLKKLAQAGYAIASASKAVPKGAQNAVPTGAEKKDASKKLDFGVHDSGVPPEIDQQMQKLQKNNPEAFKNYMAKYGKQ
jgi:hypothetical protein